MHRSWPAGFHRSCMALDDELEVGMVVVSSSSSSTAELSRPHSYFQATPPPLPFQMQPMPQTLHRRHTVVSYYSLYFTIHSHSSHTKCTCILIFNLTTGSHNLHTLLHLLSTYYQQKSRALWKKGQREAVKAEQKMAILRSTFDNI